MILVSATLVLALMLYAYFTGIFAQQRTEQLVTDLVASYTTGISSQTILIMSNHTVSGEYLYCIMVSISNNGGDVMKPYFTVIPGVPGVNIVDLSNYADRVPIDYTYSPPKRDVYVYLAYDYDQDGIVDLVGTSGGSRVQASPNIESCLAISSNSTIKNNDFKPVNVQGTQIILDLESKFTYSALASQVTGLSENVIYLPLWSITLEPASYQTIYIYVESPVPLDKLTLLTFAQINNNYYLANSLLMYSSG